MRRDLTTLRADHEGDLTPAEFAALTAMLATSEAALLVFGADCLPVDIIPNPSTRDDYARYES